MSTTSYDAKEPAKGELVFHRYGNQYFLNEILSLPVDARPHSYLKAGEAGTDPGSQGSRGEEQVQVAAK